MNAAELNLQWLLAGGHLGDDGKYRLKKEGQWFGPFTMDQATKLLGMTKGAGVVLLQDIINADGMVKKGPLQS